MAALSRFLSQIYTIIFIFFAVLFFEILTLISSFRRSIYRTKNRLVTTSQFLKFIEEKNPTTCYKKKLKRPSSSSSSSSSDEQPPECVVCLSDFKEGEKIRILKCKHTFHKDCLDRWLQQYLATCPLCRTKVVPDEVVAKFQQMQNLQAEYDGIGGDEEIIFLLSSLHGNSLHRFF